MTGDVRPRRRRRSATTPAASGPTNYIYRDDSGEPVFRVVRGRGKRFHQERLENGEWVLGTRSVQKLLYNMPAVAEAVGNGRIVWIVEGEKDADALNEQGLVATTNPGGAGAWRDEYSYMLLGAKRVNIVWDKDERDPKTGKYPGQEHALHVEASLRAVGLQVRMLCAKEGKDVSDHLAAGHAIHELLQERPGPPLAVPMANGNGNGRHAEVVGPKRQPAVFQLALLKLKEYAEEHGLPQPRETETGYEVCCPAHDDRSPSLGIRVGDEQPLVIKCQAGCTLHEIADALDIDPKEFSALTTDVDAATQKRLEFLRADANARTVLADESAPPLELPMDDPKRYLTEPLPEFPFTVEELHIEGSNTLVVSQYKVGKSLALETPIPTPAGWTTMGELQVGDVIFDELGRQTRVKFVTPVQYERTCYELTFSDGSSIVADKDHLWRTRTLRPAITKERTTEEILETLYTPDGHHRNHRIDVAEALETEEVWLPVDPYVLGAWLGDGSTQAGTIAVGDDFVLQEIERCGYKVSANYARNRPQKCAIHCVCGLQQELARLGVLGHKRIPNSYLRASIGQRIALLQGIMDTDGSCDKRGLCSVSTIKKKLADDYLELLRSLGYKPSYRIRRAIVDGKDCGEAYVIHFKAFKENPVFRMPRKNDRLCAAPTTNTRSMSRTIISVEPVPSVPVRCIQVDSSSHMYLAGKEMIPTHNTTLMINLYRSLVNQEPFLGHFEVADIRGRVAYLDYEMQRKQFQAWLAAGGGLDYDRMVAPWHLRGQSLHFWVKGVRERFVAWLQENEVKVLIIDTAARAWAGLVDNENDNTQMLKFTDALDQIKQEAGVPDLFLVTHMGRNARFFEDGDEQARGATRLEDWMDSGWYYTRDESGMRYLRALGRGIDQESFGLTHEPTTHQLLTSGVSKKELMHHVGIQRVVDIVASFEESPSMSEVKSLMKGGDNSGKHRIILEAETRGLIVRKQGLGRTKNCELTEAGRRVHERKIDIDYKPRRGL